MIELDVRGYICSQASFLARQTFLANKNNETVQIIGHGRAVQESVERVGEKYGYRVNQIDLPDNDFSLTFFKNN